MVKTLALPSISNRKKEPMREESIDEVRAIAKMLKDDSLPMMGKFLLGFADQASALKSQLAEATKLLHECDVRGDVLARATGGAQCGVWSRSGHPPDHHGCHNDRVLIQVDERRNIDDDLFCALGGGEPGMRHHGE